MKITEIRLSKGHIGPGYCEVCRINPIMREVVARFDNHTEKFICAPCIKRYGNVVEKTQLSFTVSTSGSVAL